MMARLRSRLEQLEAAREEQLMRLSDADFEAEIGTPRLMEFLYQQTDEDINLLVANDSPTSKRLWKAYVQWYEEGQL